MIRILLDKAFDNERHYIHAVGLSTDTKPTTGIITGSKFVAVDTGAGYLFDETSGEWHENTQLSEAVAAYLDEHPEALDQAAIEAMFGDQLDGIEEDVGGLKSAIEDLEAGSLSAVGASIGQVPTADGAGSWEWGDSGFVTPEMFGAVGDGVTDDTEAVQAAINTGRKVLFSNKTYLITPITIAKSSDLLGEDGAKIVTAQHTNALTFLPALKNRLYMAEDYDHLDYTSDSGVSRIKLTSLGNVAVGDLVYVYATNQSYIQARQYYYKGCTALVTDVDTESNSIYINFAMPFDIEADGTVVDVYKPLNVRIQNIDFESSLDLEAITGSAGVRIWYSAFCGISKCNFYGFTSELILYNCVMSNIEDCSFAYAKPDNTLHWDGYGIMIASCNVTTIKRVTATCGQHAISTGGNTPVFGTVIQDCRLFSECTTYAIGLHDNDHDCVVERSVVGGMWGCGNLTAQDVRMVPNANGGVVLLTGNPGDTRTNVRFKNVDFGSLYIDLNAYPQGALTAYSNDYGNIIFEDCNGGNFRIHDLSNNNLISGSDIERIKVDGWNDCLGFVLGYGNVSELYLKSLLFRITTEAGYITSQVEREIIYPCIVLNEYNLDNLTSTVQSVSEKALAITKDKFIHNSAVIKNTGAGKIKGLKIYGEMVNNSPISAPTLTIVSGNLFDVLDDFSIHLEDYSINGVAVASQYARRIVVPIGLKRKRVRLSCTIDATKAQITSINSVAAFLLDADGNVIYETYLNGYYEAIEYESTVSFVIPDETYSMVITGRLFAKGEGKEITANHFKLAEVSAFTTHTDGYALYAMPVDSDETYVDENGVKQLANYLDYDNGVYVRQIEYLYNNSITSEMVTPMLEYFDSSIVGGFIPRSLVEKPDGIGRNLSAYLSIGRTVIETATPPTDQGSIWINDGGIGFAFPVENVGERTITALVNYINELPNFLLCKIYGTEYKTLRQTDLMLYNSLFCFDKETTIIANSEAYFSLVYNYNTQKYIDGENYTLIRDMTLPENTNRVYIDNDDDGNPFELSDIVVHMNLEAADGTGVGVIVPNIGDTQPESSVLGELPLLSMSSLFSTSGQLRVARMHTIGGRFFADAEYTAFTNWYAPLYTQVNRNASGIYECDSIQSLTMFSINNYSFAAGSRIMVYGRKRSL